MIRKEDTGMDFTDKAVFGRRTGVGGKLECRRRGVRRAGGEGKGGVSVEVEAAEEWSSLSYQNKPVLFQLFSSTLARAPGVMRWNSGHSQ